MDCLGNPLFYFIGFGCQKVCQAALPDRPFDTRIHIGKFSEFRCYDPPQAENPASRILFYVQRKYVVMGCDRSCVHGRVGVYGFCRGLLSRMGRLWMADRSSASGIHAARRLTVTSMSRFPWLSSILLSKTPLQKPKHPHPPMHATPTFSIPLIKRAC